MSNAVPEVQFIDVNGDKIALRYRMGQKQPGIFWLNGYRSDMLGTKACHLDTMATETGHAMLRHDYSGHGESGGDFAQGTISRWLKQSLAVYDAYAVGEQIIVGSSMGGWIALRLAQELNKRGQKPAALLLLAPAPDFTATMIEPALSQEQRQELMGKGFLNMETDYGDQFYSKALIDDGRNNLVLQGLIDTNCPVHIIHGMRDETVAYSHTMQLMAHLPLNDVTLTLVHDGDHRLSRPQDLALLGRLIRPLLEM